MKRIFLLFASIAVFWTANVALAMLWIQPARFGTGSSPASPPYTDDFNRANQNPIAGDWESGLGANGQVKIASNAATNVSGTGTASVKASALSISSNQRAEVKLDSSTYDNNGGPVVRMQSDGSHYRLWWSYTYGQGNISKIDASGTETEIGSRFYGYPTTSDTLGLEITGTSIRPYKINGGTTTYLKASETDSALAGGQPGLWVAGGGTFSGTAAFRADNY